MQDTYSSYLILPRNNLIMCNFQGKSRLVDVIKINNDFLNDEAYNASYDVILDFRNTIAIAFEFDLQEFAKFFKKTVKLQKRVKVGILYSTVNQEFLFSIYKPIAKLLGMDVGNYRKIDDCMKWMNYSEEDQAAIKAALDSIKEHAVQNNVTVNQKNI